MKTLKDVLSDGFWIMPSTPQFIENGEIPYITSKNIKVGKIDFSNVQYISRVDFEDISKNRPIKVNDLLISMIGTLGNVAIVKESDGDFYGQNMYLLRLNSDIIDLDYFYHFFNSDVVKRHIESKKNKSTQGYLKANHIEEIKIPVPSLDKQNEIASCFRVVNDLIETRQEQINKLDELVKSRFIEMFGDPVNNSKKLPELTLPELGEFGRGVSKHRPRNDPKLLGGKYPLIQTGEVSNSNLYITEYESTYSELGFKQSKLWQKGTLCITIAANIAKTAILTFDACFPDSVVGFKANDKTNNIFIHYWFSFFQAILEAQAPESAQKNINLKTLSELKIILPPLEQQNEFATFVEQTEKLKIEVKESLEKLETLKKSLMQKYFG